MGANTNPTSNPNPFASLGPNPLERIYEQLCIITMILKQGLNITDEDYNFYYIQNNPISPNSNPNFTEPL
jgi:hypothetical protein